MHSFLVQVRTTATSSATSSSSLLPKECISKEQTRNPTLVSLSSLQTSGGGGRSSAVKTGLGKAFSHRAICFLAGSLSAFVCQHSIMALALPCKLTIPQKGGFGPQRGNTGALERLLVVTSHLIYRLVSQLKVNCLASASISTSWPENLRLSTSVNLCFLLYEMETAVIILTDWIGWGLKELVQARLLSQSIYLINRSLLREDERSIKQPVWRGQGFFLPGPAFTGRSLVHTSLVPRHNCVK